MRWRSRALFGHVTGAVKQSTQECELECGGGDDHGAEQRRAQLHGVVVVHHDVVVAGVVLSTPAQLKQHLFH